MLLEVLSEYKQSLIDDPLASEIVYMVETL